MPAIPLPSSVGIIKRVAGTDPAAGIEVTDTVPANKSWWLLSVCLTLVQGATQTPQPILIIDDGANSIFESFGSTAAQAVSTTCVYTWGNDLQITGQVGATTNVHSNAALPSLLVLPANYRIRTSTLGIGANSNYGVPSYFVCELG